MESDQEQLILMLDVDQVEHLRYMLGKEKDGLNWSEDGSEPSNQAYVEHTVQLRQLLGYDVSIQPVQVFGSWVVQGTHQQIQDVEKKIVGSVFVLSPEEMKGQD